MKVLLDVNLVLDVLIEREPFYGDSSAVFQRVEEGDDEGYLSALTFPILFYLMSKTMNQTRATHILQDLRTVFHVAPVGAEVVDRALSSGFNDFEDAIQYHSALEVDGDYVLTRNKGDFIDTDIPVLRPEEFLAAMESFDETSN